MDKETAILKELRSAECLQLDRVMAVVAVVFLTGGTLLGMGCLSNGMTEIGERCLVGISGVWGASWMLLYGMCTRVFILLVRVATIVGKGTREESATSPAETEQLPDGRILLRRYRFFRLLSWSCAVLAPILAYLVSSRGAEQIAVIGVVLALLILAGTSQILSRCCWWGQYTLSLLSGHSNEEKTADGCGED
jgi:hypothetical protein